MSLEDYIIRPKIL